MKRTYLKPSQKIIFDNTTFEIVKTVGAGANCVVYEVKKTDDEYTYRYYLKECYPFDALIIRRKDGSLDWAGTEEKERNVKKFKDAYNMLLDIYNDECLRNSTSMPMDIYESNGTVYSLNDIKIGTTFEEDASESLSDILGTAVALSKLIGKYHKAGYLHLDIKPENIFLLDETRELLVLFDVDSVVSIDKLRNGEIKHISFSENYAAPEQKREKLLEISERTDIYGIGATLFSKIMGRFVSALDRDIFADWDFDEIPLFKGINPQVKKHIKDIFRKSLSVQPQNRYKNVGELVEALLHAKKACDSEMYLISDYPSVVKNFIGRTDELNKINEAFKNKNNVVFLHGFGGVGKSELSKKFAQVHNNDYDAIIFCTYNGSLINTLDGIYTGNETTNDNKHNFQDKEAILKTLLTENVLLIIDNFDVDINEDEYLFELSKYKANIIITTRTDFSDCQLDCFEQINISTINKELLNEFFIKESGLNEVSTEEKGIIDEILAAYKYHTMFIKPLAYKIRGLGYTIKDLKSEVDTDLLEDVDLIVGVKNNRPYEETIKTLAEKLYKIELLDDEKQQILSDLYMLGNARITTAHYVNGIYNDCLISYRKQIRNNITTLIRLGLVQKDELNETLEIHPIISEVIGKNIKPDISKCRNVAAFVYKKALDVVHGTVSCEYGYSNEMTLDNLCEIISKIDVNNEENVKYIIEFAFDVCKSRKHDWVIHLLGDTVKKIPQNDNDIKLLYLRFLDLVYVEYLFAESDKNLQKQKQTEYHAVNYIYNFWHKKNDGSVLFSSIFWKMILIYYSLLESVDSWGWDMYLYKKINYCITKEEEFGNTLYDYVFRYGDEDLSGSYLTEDGQWVDENYLVFVPQYIAEIYISNNRVVNEYNIDTKNKSSFDIYNECVTYAIDQCERILEDLLAKYNSNRLSDIDNEELQKIYEDIHSNRLFKGYKDELLRRYTELFVLVDTDFKYQTLLNSKTKSIQEIFETVLNDASLNEVQKNKYLYECMYKISVSYKDPFSYEAQVGILNCFGKYSEQLIFQSFDRIDNSSVTNVLFAYFMTDYDKFSEIIQRIINNSIEKISDGITVWAINFSELIGCASLVNKCSLIYPYICNYAEEIYTLSKEITVVNLKYILKNCVFCSEAAYKETGKEEYKKEYRRYRERLNGINSISNL